MNFDSVVHAKAIELVRHVVEMTTEAGSGHPSSAASLAHLVTVLLYVHMRHDPRRPEHPKADRLVLSEGHACPIVYAAAADLGVEIRIADGDRRSMTWDDTRRLRAIDSPIEGHPNPAEGFGFFPAPTGSLGQGLSIAAGLAIAARLDRSDRNVFCVIGDGESREGQIWEALDMIAEQGLHAVLPIFNCNAFGQTGPVSDQQSPERLAAKLNAFGFDVETIDGHDPTQIRAALQLHRERSRLHTGEGEQDEGGDRARPLTIVAQTVKGWGVRLLQGPEQHGKPVPSHDLELAREQLERTRRALGAQAQEHTLQIPPIAAEPATEAPARRDREAPPSLDETLRAADRGREPHNGRLATRDAYGFALRALGRLRTDVVVLDGDVSNSTKADEFAEDPQLAGRFVECRIAEQNMLSCAAGLAAAGKTPFVSTFGKFLSRAFDQIEMALLGRFSLKLVGSHAGVTASADGPSQMALADVGFFRSLSGVADLDGDPLIHVLTPADGYAAYALTFAMADHDGACYLRTLRPAVPFLYDGGQEFPIGGHHVLAEGEDLLIVAWGYAVHEALRARDLLARDGVHAAVVDCYSLPLDRVALAQLVRRCAHRVVTVEDNFAGGLGSAVADAVTAEVDAAPVIVRQLAVRRWPKSARAPAEELAHLDLAATHIAAAGRRLARAS